MNLIRNINIKPDFLLLNNHFDRLIHNSPNLICRYNLKKEIEFMNQEITQITGKSPDFFNGKSIHDFDYPASFFAEFKTAFDSCVKTLESQEIFIFSESGDFSGKHFSIQFVPIVYPEVDPEKVFGVFTISKDITKGKELENTQKQDGRGVGLLITKNQIKTLGSSISVKSAVGVGTTFTIVIGKEKVII